MEASEHQNRATLLQPQDEVKQSNISLPKVTWFTHSNYYHGGFWCPQKYYESAIAFQTHFQAHDTDIILTSLPKTGTTWIKSLLYTIVQRKNLLSPVARDTLEMKNPHELILQLEIKVYENNEQAKLTETPPPRLFATHMPYRSLPNSIKTSKCGIVYVCCNPFDTFVSLWHFYLQFDKNKGTMQDTEMMEEYVGKFCKGESPFGPYEDHLLEYWKESKQNPEKVLFLEYEGLKKEPKAHLKRLAEFVGCPFSEEEENENVIDEIINICSLKSLKEMEINKSGKVHPWVKNKALFRKGEVGDWVNYLTPSMAKQFDAILEKLKEASFYFT